MKKKIIIGSVLGAAILILLSFTSVIGYTNVESNVKNSPLFNIRTNRTIGRENKLITCNYVSKGINLLIPKREDKTVLTKQIINSIRKMDDNTFETLTTYLINIARKDNMFNGISNEKIREALYFIKNSYEPQLNFVIGKNNNNNITFGLGGAIGVLSCLLALLLLPFTFIIWCLTDDGGSATGVLCPTATKPCPTLKNPPCYITLRKLK